MKPCVGGQIWLAGGIFSATHLAIWQPRLDQTITGSFQFRILIQSRGILDPGRGPGRGLHKRFPLNPFDLAAIVIRYSYNLNFIGALPGARQVRFPGFLLITIYSWF